MLSCHSKKETNHEQQETSKKEIPLQQQDTNQTKEILAEKEMHSLKNATVHNPFLDLDFDEVIAFDYETHVDSEQPYIVSNDGKLNPTVTQQKVLKRKQVSTLKTFLGSIETYGHAKAFCFEPHLGIVFYKNKKVVEHVSICISCNHLASSIEIPATYFKTYTFELDSTTKYPLEGFSPKAKKIISDFCSSLDFSHCKN